MKRYNPSEIEPKWQITWASDARYEVTNSSAKPKYYVTGMFPYPSGAGMHTGHFMEHSIVDSVARFRRALGYDVMYPIGWDSFGLPAENYAIKTGKSPQETTQTNIESFKNQLRRVGASIDWSREINTADPEYYKWTQWIFTKLFERGLAYQKEAMQWWCPKDKTVLANEQVVDGKCWRCESIVVKKSMKQWFFKITDYADALLEEIPDLNWPAKIKLAQTNWIGRSEGAEVEFMVDGADSIITVFTTRPDTLFGATFLVLAPEHPLVSQLIVDDTRETVEAYVSDAVKKSEIERSSEGKEKTGVFSGSYAINPANGQKVPIWIADYVLGGYGTGAIMAVPAHDERDFEFATKFDLPIIEVVTRDFGDKIENAQAVEGAVVVGYDPNIDKYLSLNHIGKARLVSGGREEGESFEDVARRELLEEAGYGVVEALIPLGSMYSYYVNSMKGPRRSLGYNFLAIIDSTQEVRQNLEEHENFSPQWHTFDELLANVMQYASSVDHWIEGLQRAQLAVEAYKKDEMYQLETYHGEGTLLNSGSFNGMSSSDAREEIVAWLEQQKLGRSKVSYKMRDWLISRQRYWGAPIPIIHCNTHGAVAVPEKDLPVLLPVIEDFAPRGDGLSALAAEEDWVNTTCPTCGAPAKRETDTMDGYACSSWYLLRYTDPHNTEQAWNPEIANYWAPLDMYIGGDHAVAHLLYVRFWTHVFKDMGLVTFKEPVNQLVFHGLIQAEDGRKMSKSLGNTVDPLEVIDQGYGADALRTFELFLGPINENSNWSSRGIAGVYRFLNRVWTLVQEYEEGDKTSTDHSVELLNLTHASIKKVTDDIHRLSFNTAIAALMELVNELYKLKLDGFSTEWQFTIEALIKMLQPLAPHMAAELWQELGHDDMIDFATWPVWDESKIVHDTMTIIVQVNGKVRAKLEFASSASEDEIKKAALMDGNVEKFLACNEPKKVIYIKGKLVSVVA